MQLWTVFGRKAPVAGLLLFLVCAVCVAQTKPTTPKPGSAERKAVLDVLRVPVERDLKCKVVFKIDELNVLSDWAFMRGVPLKADGKPMIYKGTKYEQAQKGGIFDDWICALLHREKGKWKLKACVIGATDVAWDGWDKEYKAPKAIFK